MTDDDRFGSARRRSSRPAPGFSASSARGRAPEASERLFASSHTLDSASLGPARQDGPISSLF
ncbi:hypothetical protein NS226_18620 [Aureimonas ureilytica]|uniref:Uncharacterized protein n=1 Tax=Aureimonas ureilytica TaxID=401562 RepID=A0A175R6D5_9HYPH|nr:hypothetical protein NS226_18620 [Aureimonas ureilytica]